MPLRTMSWESTLAAWASRASMEAATGDRLKPTTRLPSPSLPKNCRRVMRVVIMMITSPARLVGSPGRCACASRNDTGTRTHDDAGGAIGALPRLVVDEGLLYPL